MEPAVREVLGSPDLLSLIFSACLQEPGRWAWPAGPWGQQQPVAGCLSRAGQLVGAEKNGWQGLSLTSNL